jgi:hypothetical protein
MTPGIHDLSMIDYHGDNSALSKGGLKTFSSCPARYRYQRDNPAESTDAMRVGSAFHCLATEPETFEDLYVVWTEGRRYGKKWNEFREQAGSREIITAEQFESVNLMVNELKNHPLYEKLLTGGIPERSFFWNINGVLCKCRPDYLPGDGVVTGLKTSAQNVDHDTFSRIAYNLKYHWEAAWYLNGVTACTNSLHNRYVFFCVEQNPPYLVAAYEMSETAIDLAWNEINPLLEMYIKCLTKNFWPGYPEEIQELELPRWAYKKEVNYE